MACLKARERARTPPGDLRGRSNPPILTDGSTCYTATTSASPARAGRQSILRARHTRQRSVSGRTGSRGEPGDGCVSARSVRSTEMERAMADQQLLIAGEWVDARSGREYEQRFPFTGEVVGSAAAAGPDDANAAADAAHAAFAEWSRSQPGERRRILSKAADLLSERAERIAETSPRRPAVCSGGGCSTSSWPPGWCARPRRRRTATGEVIPSDIPGKLAMGVREPAGVVVGIAPVERAGDPRDAPVATPMAYANTVVLKASELCPRTHAAGRPRDRRRRRPARRDQPHHQLPRPTRRGRRRADRPSSDTAHQLHRLDPRRADHRRERRTPPQARAARARRQGADDRAGRREPRRARPRRPASARSSTRGRSACRPSGSSSTGRSPTRFAQLLAARARALTVGDPRDPARDRAADQRAALERVAAIVEDACAGARRSSPAARPSARASRRPSSLGVTPEMRAYAEESFGPLVSVVWSMASSRR